MTVNVLAIVPNSLIASMQETLDDGTVVTHAPEAIRNRVQFGRPLTDATAYSMRVADVETVETLLAAYPDVQLIGAWNIPEKGEVGQQVMPLDKDLYLEVMEDEVERDEEGNEISRTRPTELKQVNLWGSQYPAGRDLS